MPSRTERKTHHLLNKERKKRGLKAVPWSRKMYSYAKRHSSKMAKRGKLFHSNRFALEGGENVCWDSGKGSPASFVKSWMTSPPHRAWILDMRVKSAAIGISRSKSGTYVAWSFSDKPPNWKKTFKKFRKSTTSPFGFIIKLLKKIW